jgi:hypothetical protein
MSDDHAVKNQGNGFHAPFPEEQDRFWSDEAKGPL